MSKKSMKQFNAKNTASKKAVKLNKRKMAEWVLAILILIWTVGTVLGVVGFVRTLPKASAESVSLESIQRKSLVVNRDGDMDFTCRFPLMDIVFDDDSYGGFSYLCSKISFQSIRDDRFLIIDGVSFRLDTTTTTMVSLGNSAVTDTYDSVFYIVAENSWRSSTYYYPYSCRFENLGYDIGEEYGGAGALRCYITERGYNGYLDSYTWHFDIACDSFLEYYIIGERFDTAIEEITFVLGDESFQSYLTNSSPTEAVNNAYNNGYADGYSQGEIQGYNNGYNVGKADGFTDGVSNANEYSFAGLLGSVIDVPVNAFKSLFNFEILGINLSSFLMALLTIMIILAITKLFI